MASFKTDLATAQDNASPRYNMPDGRKITGETNWLEAVYTATGTEATSGDTIEVGDIPPGTQVIAEDIKIANEASMGGSVIALTTIGDAGDADRYSGTSISIHSSNAAVQGVTPNVGASVIPRYTVTEANKRILVPITRTNALTAGKKITFRIPFR